jgi:hypothetical protein
LVFFFFFYKKKKKKKKKKKNFGSDGEQRSDEENIHVEVLKSERKRKSEKKSLYVQLFYLFQDVNFSNIKMIPLEKRTGYLFLRSGIKTSI